MRRNKLLFFLFLLSLFSFFYFFSGRVVAYRFVSYFTLFILLAKYDKDWASVKSAVLIFLKNKFVIGGQSN